MRAPDTRDGLPADLQRALQAWLDDVDPAQRTALSAGYQGRTWLFEHDGVKFVVKAASRTGPLGALLAFTVRHEFGVYKRLQGITGIPRCYGFYKNRYLVLEYVPGETLRKSTLEDREYFYGRFFEIVQQMHERGVAHVDLKRKDNILVVDGREPYFVDFGVAFVRRPRFRPLNAYLFHLGRRFDYNAWIKHKYRRQYNRVSEADEAYLHRTVVERFSRFVKQGWRRLFG